jgi:multifunctional beta-oxidation protein
LTPEAIAARWKEVTDFSRNTTHPESTAEAASSLMAGAKAARANSAKGPSGNKVLEKAQSIKIPLGEYKYDSQEGLEFVGRVNPLVILYNLGLGAKRTDLNLVFEGANGFEVLPTFGVIPQFNTQSSFPLGDILPNFSPASPRSCVG